MTKTPRNVVSLTLIALGMSFGCFGDSLAQQHPAAINFADIGNIRSWQPDGNQSILIENQHGDWFRASFWVPCVDLPFSIAVAFVTEPNGDLNRYSSLFVDGERCWFKEFEQTTAPATRDGRHKIQ